MSLPTGSVSLRCAAPTGLPTADEAVAYTLLNCLLRELSGPEHQTAVADGRVRPGERAVLFNCATGLKYPMPEAGTPLKLGAAIDWSRL